MKFQFAKLVTLSLLFFALLFPALHQCSAAVVGDTVPNLVLPYRTNASQVFRLYDFKGQIILMEFFAHWCPHCREGTPIIHRDIEQYYAARGGNNDGVPVTVVYCNLEWQPGADQVATDEFIRTNNLKLVVNDYYQEGFAALGQPPGGTPRLAVINGVTNSISHQPWVIRHTSDGYGGATIGNLRAAIDSIKNANLPPQLPAPRKLSNGNFEFRLRGQKGRTNFVEFSTNAANWTVLTNLINDANGDALFRGADPLNVPRRLYRARVRQ